MIKASLRGLLQRKLRLSLAIIAIVLSVGFLSGALVLADTLTTRFSALFSTINQNVAVSIQAVDPQSNSPARLTSAQLAELSRVDGVQGYSGDVSAEGVIPYRSTDDKAVTAQVSLGAGVDGRPDPLGLVELREGSWPGGAGEVAVTAFTAEQAKVTLGDSLKVFLPKLNEPRTFRVVGIVGYSGGRDSLVGETMVLFQEAFAQETFYGRAGVYAGASFSAADGVSQAELKSRIAAKLPSGFTARTGDEQTRDDAEQIGGVFDLFKYVLIGFAVVAAMVGIILIFNTFNIIVAQRARELALLRALGAGWGQVSGSVLLEALIVSLVGSTLGLLAGIGIGATGLGALSSRVDLPGSGLEVRPLTVILAYLLGVMVTMISAFIPAVRASAVPPIAAMRDLVRPDKSLLAISIVGAAFAVPGIGLIALALAVDLGGATFPALLAGAVLLVVGALLLSPLLSRPVVRGVGVLLSLVAGRGQAGRLGVRNALRNPRRTAVTAVALTVGVTLIAMAATVSQSLKSSIEDVMGSSIGVEVIIQAANTAPPNGEQGFDPKALDRVRAIPGVKEAAAWHVNTVGVAFSGQPAFAIIATDVEQAQRMFAMEATEGTIRRLAAQELVVDSNSAKSYGWKANQQVKIRMGSTERDYTVVGIYTTSPVVQGVLLGEPAIADFGGPLAYQGFVSLRQGTDAQPVVDQVSKIMNDYPGVQVGDRQSYVEQQTASFDFLLKAIKVLLLVALVIAVLGILNTLLLSIFERTRELGLVRAVGMNRGGVVRMISVESVLIAVFGCVLGLALGVALGSAFTQALINMKFVTVLAVPWTELATYVMIAVLAGVVAAVIPAWRAARLNVLDAISYE